ncbi:MAG: hypothetical protein M3409_01555, partial [Gemmatimonadota bacterium]|nr:hypothetical protein [Gemmatimonadota bacterium]
MTSRAESRGLPDAADLSAPRITAAGGMRYMAIAAFWFSLMSLLVRVAGDRLPSQQVVLARGAVTALLTWAMVRRAGIPLRGGRERLLW